MVKVLKDYYKNCQLLIKRINLHCSIKFVSFSQNNVKNCFKNLSAPFPNFTSKEYKSYENLNHIEELINKKPDDIVSILNNK